MTDTEIKIDMFNKLVGTVEEDYGGDKKMWREDFAVFLFGWNACVEYTAQHGVHWIGGEPVPSQTLSKPEYGCLKAIGLGAICSSKNNFLCDECTEKLINRVKELEAAEQRKDKEST